MFHLINNEINFSNTWWKSYVDIPYLFFMWCSNIYYSKWKIWLQISITLKCLKWYKIFWEVSDSIHRNCPFNLLCKKKIRLYFNFSVFDEFIIMEKTIVFDESLWYVAYCHLLLLEKDLVYEFMKLWLSKSLRLLVRILIFKYKHIIENFLIMWLYYERHKRWILCKKSKFSLSHFL